MQMPNIKTSIKVAGTGFTLHVIAYRKLTEQEKRQALGMWLQRKKLKKPPKSGEGTIIAIHGFDGV